jgi:tripartite-type tricarboxylate transporter receptor subunit TctC
VSPLAISPALYTKLPYNPIRDFAPISLLADTTAVLVVHPSLPVSTVTEFIRLAKSKPKQLIYASSGSGSTNHLTTEMFASLTGTRFVHVPYKSASQALTDLISGVVSFMFVNVPVVLPQLRADKLRGLAVASAKRSALVPKLPTIAESGVRGFDLSGTWYGVVAPSATPPDIVAKLNSAIVSTMNAPDLKSRFAQAGLDVIASTPVQFEAYLQKQITLWGRIAEQAGARVD